MEAHIQVTCSELKWHMSHTMHVRAVSFSEKWGKLGIIGLSDSYVIREMSGGTPFNGDECLLICELCSLIKIFFCLDKKTFWLELTLLGKASI